MPVRCVVVLAGGGATRFGRDKLAEPLGAPDGPSVLDFLLTSLPPVEVVVVGPRRPLARRVRWVIEDPPGGGPAAAMVAGLRAVAAPGSPEIAQESRGWVGVLPGDAPGAAGALAALTRALEDAHGRGGAEGTPVAAVAVDATGREQPLQIVLTSDGVRRLLEAVGSGDGNHLPVRPFVQALDPIRVTVSGEDSWDVDTADQLQAWRLRDAASTQQIVAAVRGLRRHAPGHEPTADRARPVVVALDGGSGAGKSVLAQAVALHTGGSVLDGDDFYAPRLGREGLVAAEARSVAELADDGVIDWRRLRSQALEPLAAGRPARYHPYDWDAYDGRLLEREVVVEPAPVVIVDGVFSARPELADLVDLRVLVRTPAALRTQRVVERDENDPRWLAVWSSAEQHYFTHVSPPDGFDLLVSGADVPGTRPTS